MIQTIIEQGNQMNLTRWSVATASDVVSLPEQLPEKDVCLCDFSITPCSYYELAFADLNAINDEYRNDYRKFILNPLTDTSTFSFSIKGDDGVETVIYSSTVNTGLLYATILEQGSNDDRPLQVGINIYWAKIAASLGYSDYTVITKQTDFGNEIERVSHKFRVVPYNDVRANGTIKIEVDNKGVTMNGNDWTGLNTFTNMIRVKGSLTLTDPEIEIESVLDANRETIPIQTTITDNYSININHLTFGLSYNLINESAVMNWIVTDYNLFNEDNIKKEIIITSTSVNNTENYQRKSFELTGKSNISKLNRKFV